jgi:hypothetical protein
MHDSEAMQRGYRYFKQLQTERRGYAFIRDTIAEFLINRRWELGQQRDQVYIVALELVDALMNAGALALYQCGIDVENSGALSDQQKRKEETRRKAELERVAEQARDEERQRVDVRLAEIDKQRAAEQYELYLRRELAHSEEMDELAKLPRITPVRTADGEVKAPKIPRAPKIAATSGDK